MCRDRQVVNGMVYKIRTGISRRDLPERHGPWKTVYTRFRRYALDGVFTRALQQIQARADAAGDIDWLAQIDSTIVRAHQHAAATGRKGGSNGGTNRTITPSGRPRGGLTTKIHLACDGHGRPLAILLTPGQRRQHLRTPLLERVRVPRTGRGRPPCRSDQIVADKGYSSRDFHAYLRKRGIACTIPEKSDQQRHRRNRGCRCGRPPAFGRRVTTDATSSNVASTALKASAVSRPDTTRPPPPTKQRSLSCHSCSGQGQFEDGP